jgi:hypothetical protein
MVWMEPDNVLAHPSLFSTKTNLVWGDSLLVFVLSNICELVKRGVNRTRGFKEQHLQSVCNDVRVSVTPIEV